MSNCCQIITSVENPQLVLRWKLLSHGPPNREYRWRKWLSLRVDQLLGIINSAYCKSHSTSHKCSISYIYWPACDYQYSFIWLILDLTCIFMRGPTYKMQYDLQSHGSIVLFFSFLFFLMKTLMLYMKRLK